MKDHAREKDTAAWLAQEYGGSSSLFVVRAGSPEETQLPWPKVQRRIAQLIQEDRFYTEEEPVSYTHLIIRKDAHNFTVPKRCVSVPEPYSAERRNAASERAKAAGYQPPMRKSRCV